MTIEMLSNIFTTYDPLSVKQTPTVQWGRVHHLLGRHEVDRQHLVQPSHASRVYLRSEENLVRKLC